MKLTITEALAELKLIDKKLENKQSMVKNYATRSSVMKDPLEKGGGSVKVLQEEQQSIGDLLNRKIALRRAIHNANATTEVTVGSKTMTIADWLVWKREVAATHQKFLAELRAVVDRGRATYVAHKQQQPDSTQELVVNVDEFKLNRDNEEIQTILQSLDGQLSLKNATVVVEV